MDLPLSLLAVVHSVESYQSEEQDFTIGVRADRVRITDFSPYVLPSQVFNFDLEDKAGKKYNELEDDESIDDDDVSDLHYDYREKLVEERQDYTKNLFQKSRTSAYAKGWSLSSKATQSLLSSPNG